ncbi:MAG: hypothetical protein N2C13_02600 [Chloroflexota bacterium]
MDSLTDEKTLEISKDFHSSIAEIWIDDNGICRAVLAPLSDIGIQETKEFFVIQKQILADKRVPVLFDMRGLNSSTVESRTYAAQHARELQATAIAILDNTSLGHVLGNLFVRLSKPHYPTKLFSKENEAIVWLNTYASLDTLSVNEGKQ